MLNRRFASIGYTLFAVALLPAALAQAFEISWHTIDGGGGNSTGGNVELQGTIGQHDAGAMTGGNFGLSGGFWFQTPPGDCNATGTVNLLDHAELAACLSGPNGGLGTGCACFDFDTDNDIDLLDFAEFQIYFQGSQ